jgi:RNA polymerase sigma factor (TIGR02999 family)
MTDDTRILEAIDRGDPQGAGQLFRLVYDELRRLAAAQMAGERPGQTLDATALVHEAYLRLAGGQKFENRQYFFAAAAKAMRRILVEHARSKVRLKRGGGWRREDVELDALPAQAPDEEVLALHDTLERLAAYDPAKAALVELHFFGGLSLPEAAGQLGISLSTAERGWRYARAWLYAAMAGSERSASS